MSEAGRLITSRHCLRQLRRLGQRLGEGELRLEAAGRQVALVVQLARIGHPLVDQDQARAVVVEQLAQHVAGAGRLLVVRLQALRRLLPCRPSCQASSPHSVRTTVPSGFVTGLPGEILLPTSTTRFTFGSVVDSGLLQHARRCRASSPGAVPENRW